MILIINTVGRSTAWRQVVSSPFGDQLAMSAALLWAAQNGEQEVESRVVGSHLRAQRRLTTTTRRLPGRLQ
jgi:hypothetical protein